MLDRMIRNTTIFRISICQIEVFFLEVKNPYLFENDSKVQILRATRDDIIWLTSLEQIQNFK